MMHVDKDKCEGNGTITSSFVKKKKIFFNLIVKWIIYSHPFVFSSSFSFLFHFDCKRDHLFPSFSRFLIFFPSFSNLFAKGIIVDLVFYSMRSQSMTWLAFNLFGENLIFRKRFGVANYFCFIFLLREKPNKKENPKCDSWRKKTGLWKTKSRSEGQVTCWEGTVVSRSTPLSPYTYGLY